MGPWAHSMPFGVQGDLDFGSESLALASVHTTQLGFFDRYLKDGADALPPVRYFVMGANEWRDADQWPPPGTTTQCWYLHTGTISRQPPQAGEPPDRYLYDPAYPVPTLGGRIGGVAGRRDQSRLARRDDVLCFTSDPLSASLEVIGSAVLVLYAASSSSIPTSLRSSSTSTRTDRRSSSHPASPERATEQATTAKHSSTPERSRNTGSTSGQQPSVCQRDIGSRSTSARATSRGSTAT